MQSQPIMTRKMAKRECQREEETKTCVKSSLMKPAKVAKNAEKWKTESESTSTAPTTPDEKRKSSTTKLAKKLKAKKAQNVRETKNNDEVSINRRSLRSRNVVVLNDRLGKKLRKKALQKSKNKKTRFQLRSRKEGTTTTKQRQHTTTSH